MIEDVCLRDFLDKYVGVVYTDSGKDFILKGILVDVRAASLTINHPRFGKSIISLDSIKKVMELRYDDKKIH